VKSELIVRRKLREEHFITRNYTDTYNDLNYAVIVMLKFPRDIIRDKAAEETVADEPGEVIIEMPEEAVIEKPKANPVVLRNVVEDQITGGISKVEVILYPKRKAERTPKYANYKTSAFYIQTNLLYWLVTTPNLGIEWIPDVEKSWSVLLNGAWTHWEWKERTRKYRMWLISPEVRRYLSDRWFVGGELHIGDMNIKLDDTGHQGPYFGAGVTGGYRLPIGDRFDIDFTLGLGYTRFDKDNYKMINGLHVATKTDIIQHLWGPTQAGVILRYKLK
jgi:hypothetical protein